MCAGAIVLARLPRMVYGTADPKTGACGTLYNIVQDDRLNHRLQLETGILEVKCAAILKDFFKKIRVNEMGKPGLN
jgi:tRNA(adenine34) deaminase